MHHGGGYQLQLSTPSVERRVLAVGGIPVESLEGKILFTRAGGEFGDETVYTMDADGTDEQRIAPFGEQCCPRWSPDGEHILISALSEDDRIATAITSRRTVRTSVAPIAAEEPQPRVHAGVVRSDGVDSHARVDRIGILRIYSMRASEGMGFTRVTRCSAVRMTVRWDTRRTAGGCHFLRALLIRS